MAKSLVITLIGNDRPGIVESVSELVLRHKGEWVESRMANLSGKFAGILRVILPDEEYPGFARAIESSIAGLKISIEEVDSPPVQSGQCYRLELVGQDRPGIVHRISSALAAHGASVDEMESEVCEASMSGETLFKASITLCLAEGADINALSEVLEDLANELIVDIELG